MQQLNTPLPDWIIFCHDPACRLIAPLAVDPNVVAAFHPLARAGNYRVRHVDDGAGGAVILDQIFRLCTVVLLELTDELDRGPLERIDVLIVVAHGKKTQTQVFVFKRPSCHCRDQRIFLCAHILILIDQNPAIALDKCFTLGFGLGLAQTVAVQLAHCFHNDVLEIIAVSARSREACAHKPHSQRMAGGHCHAASLVTY